MRSSSIIFFASFALLASTFPINGINQDNNSLWKRTGPASAAPASAGSESESSGPSGQQHVEAPNQPSPPTAAGASVDVSVYRGLSTGTVIRNGGSEAWVSSEHDRQEIKFYYNERPNPEGSRYTPSGEHRYTFTRHRVLEMEMQDYWNGRRMLMSVLICPNGNYIVFSADMKSNEQYDMEESHHDFDSGRYSREYYHGMVLRVQYHYIPHHWSGPSSQLVEQGFDGWNHPEREAFHPQQ